MKQFILKTFLLAIQTEENGRYQEAIPHQLEVSVLMTTN